MHNMNTFFKKNNNKGFTLVETIVSIFILVASIVPLMIIIGGNLQTLDKIKDRMYASYLAQEGVEMLRYYRDTYRIQNTDPDAGWSVFLANFYDLTNPSKSCEEQWGGCDIDPMTAYICYGADSTCELSVDQQDYYSSYVGVSDTGFGGISSRFNRKIVVKSADASSAQIDVIVDWNQGFSPQSLTISTVLYKW